MEYNRRLYRWNSWGYFIADMGTGTVNYLNGNGFKTLSDVIDQSDWGQRNTKEMYEGLY